jgi:hypothetical protein
MKNKGAGGLVGLTRGDALIDSKQSEKRMCWTLDPDRGRFVLQATVTQSTLVVGRIIFLAESLVGRFQQLRQEQVTNN